MFDVKIQIVRDRIFTLNNQSLLSNSVRLISYSLRNVHKTTLIFRDLIFRGVLIIEPTTIPSVVVIKGRNKSLWTSGFLIGRFRDGDCLDFIFSK